jgi:ABC-type transporter Mla subunit MlaD
MAHWQTGLLAAAVLLAGCGGDSGSSASEDYANDVCGDVSSWVADIEDTLESLGDKGLSVTQEDLQAAVDDTKNSTETLVRDLDELDPPETDAGTEAKTELDKLASQLQQQLDTIEQTLNGSGPPLMQVSTITAAVSTAAKEIQSAYDNLKGLDPAGELQDAFRNADECKTLGDQLENAGSGS